MNEMNLILFRSEHTPEPFYFIPTVRAPKDQLEVSCLIDKSAIRPAKIWI